MTVSKKSICVCGWWGSANLGDRFQPLIIAKQLIAESVDFKAMGYHSTGKGFFVQKYPNNPWLKSLKIHDPSHEDVEYVIAVTGSLSHYSYSTKLLKQMVEESKTLKKMIVWGGFQDVVFGTPGYKTEDWKWLTDSRVVFIARSVWDINCLRKLSGDIRIGSLGGDPMCNWVEKTYFSQLSMENPIALVMSQLCLEKYPKVGQELLEIARECDWKVGCFDGHKDSPLIQKYGFTFFKTPEHYLKWLQGVGGVVSTRLHAAVLASVARIPTVAIGTNEKFAAVGLSGLDDRILFPVSLKPQLALGMLGTGDDSVAYDYLYLSQLTLKKLTTMLRE